MVAKLWAWMVGYLVIRLRGPRIEDFLSHVAMQEFSVWGIERLTADVIVARVSIGHFIRLRKYLWSRDIQVAIVEKKGLPFVLKRCWKRIFLFLGFFAFMAFVFYMSSFVWFIQIEGAEDVSREAILDLIIGRGLRIGLPKGELNPKDIEVALLSEFPELAWAGVNVRGVLVHIQVVERSIPDWDTKRTGDIVAKRDGIVTEVMVFQGTPHVHKGQTVRQGDLLISGEYYDQYGRRQQGRAEGLVRARVWYEAFGEAALSRITQMKTGTTHVGYQIAIGNRVISYRMEPPFSPVTVKRYDWQPEVQGRPLPMKFSRFVFDEVEYHTESIDEKTALKLAEQRAWKRLREQGLDVQRIRNSRVEEFDLIDQDGVRVNLFVELEENIGEFVLRQ